MRRNETETLVSAGARARGLILACAIAVVAAAIPARNNHHLDGWTLYVNARWGFCAEYPAAWKALAATDGGGVTFYPDASADPGSGPYISISAIPDLPDIDNANVVLDDSPPLNLEGNFARSMENLREYDHASDMRVLEKRRLEFQGFDALSTSIRYRAGAEGADLADETFWINKEYIIFTVSLFGRPEQAGRLEPVYRDIVMHRFLMVCPGRR